MRAIYEAEIAQLRAIVDTLKGALALDHPLLTLIEQPRGWMATLTRQERALTGALMACSPRAIPRIDLLEMLPGRDHVADRQVQLVTTVKNHVCAKLGRGAIKSIFGEGYFMPETERDRLLGQP